MRKNKRKKTLIRLIIGLLITSGLLWLIGLSLQGATDYMYLEEQQWTMEHEECAC